MRGRSLVLPLLSMIAGLVILAFTLTTAEPISLGSALGVLLLLSAAVRFELARRSE